MYLSYFLVDTGSNPDRPRPGRLWLRNLYHVHQRLCMAFPSTSRLSEDPDFLKPFVPEDFGFGHVHVKRGKDAGFLFRIDAKTGSQVVILVQSAMKPDWDYAFRNAKYLLVAPPEVMPFNTILKKGQTIRFLLRANPIKRLKEARCRVPLIQEDEQMAWLVRKLSEAAEPVDVHITERKTFWFRKAKKAGKITTVTYSGLLEVKEPEDLMKLIRSGIGPAKGFGCGLLSLARG